MSRKFQLILGWSFHASVILSAVIVLAYTYLGGLTSAIYNEVLQFFLIVLGFSPLAIVCGSSPRAAGREFKDHLPSDDDAHLEICRASANPEPDGSGGVRPCPRDLGSFFRSVIGVRIFWLCSARWRLISMSAARRTPASFAAFPKMLMPFIVILPGIAALALTRMATGYELPPKGNSYGLSQALTTLMARFYPSGMLGFANFRSHLASPVFGETPFRKKGQTGCRTQHQPMAPNRLRRFNFQFSSLQRR